ncbi:hypothetical protein ATER59S_00524 [Aquamicrobium terrae]
MLGGTGEEDGIAGLGWPSADQFHRAAERVGHDLDRNAVVRRQSRLGRGGNAVRSGAVEWLAAEGVSPVERRNIFGVMRDMVAELAVVHTGSAWRPRSGCKVNHRAMTATVIGSRDFISAGHRAEIES